MKTGLMPALLAAQQSIGGVRHDKTNSFSNYKYTSSESMVSVARKVLITNGIVSGRKNWSYECQDVTEKDREYVIKVSSKCFLTHAESGETMEETLEFPAIVRKGTPHDKAVAAALTTSLSYWLRDVLLLPRMDNDASMDRRNDNIEALNTKLLKGV